ncbi:MAG: permease [Bacillota bacterium]|nr:permease [Bacillota bacterium]
MWLAFVKWLSFSVLGLSPGTRFGEAVAFFLYDAPKVLFLLATVVFIVAVIRSFFPPERTKRILAGGNEYAGNVLAALLGIVTPFCSCSAVPLFIGFLESGVPLGVTFSFLISSPMVNEVALVLLWGLFGWKVALLYVAAGVSVAIVAGIIIGRLHLERWVEDYVWEIQVGNADMPNPTWAERLACARGYVKEILRKVWLYVVIGIGVGAFIHGYAPENLLARVAGKANPLAVPVAVLIGVPLYSNAAGTIPIVKALMEKGMAMGTALSFMMAVTALSLPEAIILRKVLKPKLLTLFFGIGAVTITAIGYLFNWLLG